MLVDGRRIAQDIIHSLGDSLRGTTLSVVMNRDDAASESFVKVKEKVAARLRVELKRFAPEQAAEAAQCDAMLVQLPIENAEALIAQIPKVKDIDALREDSPFVAPVALAVQEVLMRNKIALAGKKAVVVGEGKLVGRPVAKLLAAEGALVQVVTLEQGSLAELQDADIVVSGAGSPGLIKPDMLKAEVVLIDAGTSELAGKVVGDCDPACEQVAGIFTPVPGGVGPIAVAMLFQNLFTLTKKS